jgi:hypothetical protein
MLQPDQGGAKNRSNADKMASKTNAAEGKIFPLRFEFGIAEAQKHCIRNEGNVWKPLMTKKPVHVREAGHALNRDQHAQQKQPPKKAARQQKKQR